MIVAGTICGGAVLVVIFCLAPVSDNSGWLAFPGYMLLLGVCLQLFLLGATAHISLAKEELLVVNFLHTWRVVREEIVDIDSDNGIVITLRGGRTIESVAYGSSVLQALLPSARYSIVGDRLRRWHLGQSHSAMVRERSSRSVRRMLTLGLPLMLSATQVLGFVLYLVSPAIREWMRLSPWFA